MVRENTQNQTKQKVNDNNLQILTLDSNSKTKLYLTCVYIPPSAVINQNLTKLKNFLDNLVVDPGSYQTVCGDFNVNSMSSSKNGLKLVA